MASHRRTVLQTYGRHRQRVISVDVWADIAPASTSQPFANTSSSVEQSRSIVETSLKETQRNVKGTKTSGRQKAGLQAEKENGSVSQRRRQVFSSSSSPETSSLKSGSTESFFTSVRTNRVLRDRVNSDNLAAAAAVASSPPQRRKVTQQAKKHKLPQHCNSDTSASRFNFSEFDHYSLIVSSDSPSLQAVDSPARHPGACLTSTPHVATATTCVVAEPLELQLSGLHISAVSNAAIENCDMPSVSELYDASGSLFDSSEDEAEDGRLRSMDDVWPRRAGITYTLRPRCHSDKSNSHYSLRSRHSTRNRATLLSITSDEEEEEEDHVSGSSHEDVEDLSAVAEEDQPDDDDDDDDDGGGGDGGGGGGDDDEDDGCVVSVEDVSENNTNSSPSGCATEDGESSNMLYSIADNSALYPETEPRRNSRKSLRVVLTPIGAVNRPSYSPERSLRRSIVDGRRSVMGAQERVILECDQLEVGRFDDFITCQMLDDCVKIGEGVYGEVFRTNRDGKSVAIKVIPIEGDFPVNDEPQKSFEEIFPEIVISKQLSALRDNEENYTDNFVQVLGVHVVRGRYPDAFLRQWDAYHARVVSENDRPDVFNDDQLFIVFEFEDSGCDLESFQFESSSEAVSVLEQVCAALAVAEVALQFEHRDLHWGNVLVKRLADAHAHTCYMHGQRHALRASCVKVAIIDFTLSRLSQDGCSIFTDLSNDPTLFTGSGDYQFDIYRLMKELNGNNWQSHCAATNVLWLHYIADKLVTNKTYKSGKSGRRGNPLAKLRVFLRTALKYDSAESVLQHANVFR